MSKNTSLSKQVIFLEEEEGFMSTGMLESVKEYQEGKMAIYSIALALKRFGAQ